MHWVAGSPPTEPIRVNVRTRYRMEEVEAIVEPAGNGAAEVVFARPIRAVAPGQATVFYLDDEVIGGGRIDRVLNPAQEELLAVV